MALLLAADLGGTHARLRLSRLENAGLETLREATYPAAAYADFHAVLDVFLHATQSIDVASLAVAGPVVDGAVKLTNLPWRISAAGLRERYRIADVILINDFEALAYGIDALDDSRHVCLQPGRKDPAAVAAVIGAGTGLGHGFWRGSGRAIEVFATEAGHAGFAPRNALENELWRDLTSRFGRAMYEQILTGPGIRRLFDFFCARDGAAASSLAHDTQSGDPAAAISRHALERSNPAAVAALQLFVDIYAARAADFALSVLARRGVYIAGGIAPKILPFLQTPRFVEIFNDNPGYGHLLKTMPVYIITEKMVGLDGASAAGRSRWHAIQGHR